MDTVYLDFGYGQDLTKAEADYAALEEKTLPQTGMSSSYKLFTELAALLTITGIALIKKSCKED